jgi:hypothetical protein
MQGISESLKEIFSIEEKDKQACKQANIHESMKE